MNKRNKKVTRLKGYKYINQYDNYWAALITAISNRIRYNRACKLAEAYKKSENREYYVIEGKGSLVIFNSRERKELIRRKIFDKSADHYKLIQLACYHTSWNAKEKKAKAKSEIYRVSKIYRKV